MESSPSFLAIPVPGAHTKREARDSVPNELFVGADEFLNSASDGLEMILDLLCGNKRVVFFEGVAEGFARVVERVDDMVHAFDVDLDSEWEVGDVVGIQGKA